MRDDPQLAAYQAALLDALDQGLDAPALAARARSEPALAPFRAYVERFDPRGVEIASVLVRVWGRRARPVKRAA